MLRRVPVHRFIYKKHRARLRALRVEKQKKPARWMRADAVSEPGVQWACRSSRCSAPCTAGASEPVGGFLRGLTGLDSVAQFFGRVRDGRWGRAAGARLRVMQPTLEGSTELTRPRSCLLVRRVVLEASGGTGRLGIAPMTSEAIFRRPKLHTVPD